MRVTTTCSGIALLALLVSGPAAAMTFVAEYDGPKPSQQHDFQTAAYVENLIWTEATQGHYEIVDDAISGTAGDGALNLDEQTASPPTTQNSTLRVTFGGGLDFDALSLVVVNPADAPGDVTISAVGNSGSVSAPTTTGLLDLQAAGGFTGISELLITQNAAGAFAFDTLTVEALPEPAALPALAAAAALIAGLRRRRST